MDFVECIISNVRYLFFKLLRFLNIQYHNLTLVRLVIYQYWWRMLKTKGSTPLTKWKLLTALAILVINIKDGYQHSKIVINFKSPISKCHQRHFCLDVQKLFLSIQNNPFWWNIWNFDIRLFNSTCFSFKADRKWVSKLITSNFTRKSRVLKSIKVAS